MNNAGVRESIDSAAGVDSEPLGEWELLTEIVLALVDRPEKVFVEEREEAGDLHFRIHVAPEDLGKVIGRNGETASTIRKLIGRVSAGRRRKAFIQIVQPGWQPTPRTPSDRRNVAA
jgi:hypothetical protein